MLIERSEGQEEEDGGGGGLYRFVQPVFHIVGSYKEGFFGILRK